MTAALWADAPVGLCVIDAQMRCEAANRWTGWPGAGAGLGLMQAVPLIQVVPGLVPAIREVLASGRAIAGLKIAGPAARTWMCAIAPIRGGDGAVRAVNCAVSDVTECTRAEQAGQDLAREIDHRGQNVLSLVLGLVRLSAEAAPDDTARLIAAIEGRLVAMARVHNVLSRAKWMSGDLREIAQAELAAYDGQVDIAGPSLRLTALAAQKLALVLHELATNAAEHGALSSMTGRVGVTWMRDADGVALSWIERNGGRRPGAPGAAGFGTWLVDTTIADQLDGRITRAWEPDGLGCEIRLGRAVLAPDRGAGAPLAGRRVLLAMESSPPAAELAAALRDAGCAVVAVARDTEDAIAIAVAAGTVDAAVVDATSGGRSTQPLVAMLQRRAMAIVHVAPLAPVPGGMAGEIVLASTGGSGGLCDSVMSALHRLLAPA